MTTRFGTDLTRAPDVETVRALRFPPSSGVVLQRERPQGVQMPPRLDSPADAPFVRTQLAPRLEKIAGSIDFRRQNFAVALPAVLGATVAGPTFTIPRDQVGWLQENAIYVLAPTALTTFSLALFINGGPIPGFDDIQIPPGIANFVLLGDDDMRVPLPNGAIITTVFTNLSAAGPWTVGGMIQGWYHPLATELAVWGEAR